MKQNTVNECIGFIKKLYTSRGWKLMEGYIKDNIEVIEQRILAFNEEYAEEDKKPIYSREDIRRMRREMLQEFVDLPNKMVAHYEAQQEIEDQDLSDVKNIETL